MVHILVCANMHIFILTPDTSELFIRCFKSFTFSLMDWWNVKEERLNMTLRLQTTALVLF